MMPVLARQFIPTVDVRIKLLEYTYSSQKGENAVIISDQVKNTAEKWGIVVKIYSYFHIYTVRVEKLKDVCEIDGLDYSQLLGYVKTRFFALGPVFGRILN